MFKANGQLLQDLFTWKVLSRPTEGFFLDVGAGTGGIPYNSQAPGFYSNTYALEVLGWTGICLDNDTQWCEGAEKDRFGCKVICIDLLENNINEILEDADAPNNMQYLSLDVDDAQNKVFTELDFDKYSFDVITFEHNLFQSLPECTQNRSEEWKAKVFKEYGESKQKFSDLGYKLLWSDVILDGYGPVEDWWVSEEVYETNKGLKKHNANCKGVLYI